MEASQETVRAVFEMTPSTLALMQALITAIVTIVLAWFKASTDEKLAKIYKITHDTHTLANSGHRAALLVNARGERRWADQHPTAENIAAAEAAEKLLLDHDQAQGTVDVRNNALKESDKTKNITKHPPTL